MTPEEMLDSAIERGDLEAIKKARELIKKNGADKPRSFGNGVKFQGNQFNPTEFQNLAEVKEAKKFDKKHKIGVSQRSRTGPKQLKAICVKCKQVFMVSPILFRENFKCDDCIKS